MIFTYKRYGDVDLDNRASFSKKDLKNYYDCIRNGKKLKNKVFCFRTSHYDLDDYIRDLSKQSSKYGQAFIAFIEYNCIVDNHKIDSKEKIEKFFADIKQDEDETKKTGKSYYHVIISFKDLDQSLVLLINDWCMTSNVEYEDVEISANTIEDIKIDKYSNPCHLIFDNRNKKYCVKNHRKYANRLIQYKNYYELVLDGLDNKKKAKFLDIDINLFRQHYRDLLSVVADTSIVLIPVQTEPVITITGIALELKRGDEVVKEPYIDCVVRPLNEIEDENYTERITKLIGKDNIKLAVLDFSNSSSNSSAALLKIVDANTQTCKIVEDIEGTRVRIKRIISGIDKVLNDQVRNKTLVNLLCDLNIVDYYNGIKKRYNNNQSLVSYLCHTYKSIKDNPEQLSVMDKVLHMEENGTDVVLVQGPPGTGKTEVILSLVKELSARGKSTLVTSNVQIACDNVVERLKNDKEIILKRYRNYTNAEKYAKEIDLNKRYYLTNQVLEGFTFEGKAIDSFEAYNEVRQTAKSLKKEIQKIDQEYAEEASFFDNYNDGLKKANELRLEIDSLSVKIANSNELLNQTKKSSDFIVIKKDRIEQELEKSRIDTNILEQKLLKEQEQLNALLLDFDKLNNEIANDSHTTSLINDLLNNVSVDSFDSDIKTNAFLNSIINSDEYQESIRSLSEEELSALNALRAKKEELQKGLEYLSVNVNYDKKRIEGYEGSIRQLLDQKTKLETEISEIRSNEILAKESIIQAKNIRIKDLQSIKLKGIAKIIIKSNPIAVDLARKVLTDLLSDELITNTLVDNVFVCNNTRNILVNCGCDKQAELSSVLIEKLYAFCDKLYSYNDYEIKSILRELKEYYGLSSARRFFVDTINLTKESKSKKNHIDSLKQQLCDYIQLFLSKSEDFVYAILLNEVKPKIKLLIDSTNDEINRVTKDIEELNALINDKRKQISDIDKDILNTNLEIKKCQDSINEYSFTQQSLSVSVMQEQKFLVGIKLKRIEDYRKAIDDRVKKKNQEKNRLSKAIASKGQTIESCKQQYYLSLANDKQREKEIIDSIASIEVLARRMESINATIENDKGLLSQSITTCQELENSLSIFRKENEQAFFDFKIFQESYQIKVKKLRVRHDNACSLLGNFGKKLSHLCYDNGNNEKNLELIFEYVKGLSRISKMNDKELSKHLQTSNEGFTNDFRLDSSGKYNLVSMTTNQIAQLLRNEKDLDFDYAIVDEASKCKFEDIIISLPRVQHLVLIGDYMQLEPMIERYDEQSNEVKEILAEGDWNELNRSPFSMLFERFINFNAGKAVKEFANNPLIGILKRQYRMAEGIFNLVAPIYSIHRGFEIVDEKQESLNDVLCVNVPSGNEISVGTSQCNIEETMIIAKAIENIQLNRSDFSDIKTIGVITGYSAQVGKIRSMINHAFGGLEIGTFDRFQGREYDLVFISMVRTKSLGFLNDIRRINVALSRTKNHLIILGNFDAIKKCANEKAIRPSENSSRTKELKFVTQRLIPKLCELKVDCASDDERIEKITAFLKGDLQKKNQNRND